MSKVQKRIRRETKSEKYQKPEVKVQDMSMKALLGNGWFVDKKSSLMAYEGAS